jgi:hypothetical protein
MSFSVLSQIATSNPGGAFLPTFTHPATTNAHAQTLNYSLWPGSGRRPFVPV